MKKKPKLKYIDQITTNKTNAKKTTLIHLTVRLKKIKVKGHHENLYIVEKYV